MEKLPSAENFWIKVKKTDTCWNFIGARTAAGYGVMGVQIDQKIKCTYAHRLSWILHFGPIPGNTQVLHNCDNPACVNPDHLKLGNHADNMTDKKERGRAFQRKLRYLSDSQIREIRHKISSGMSDWKICKEYSVTENTIRKIRLGETYRDVR